MSTNAMNDKVRKLFQHPHTGELHGRMEHTYNKDSAKGHKVAKKFGGAGYRGELPKSKHVLDLRTTAMRNALKKKEGSMGKGHSGIHKEDHKEYYD